MSFKLMNVVKIISILALISANILSAQHTFERTYGGALDDRGKYVQQNTDESYIMVGTTTSYGSGEEDVYLMKIDVYGDTIWTKIFGTEYIELSTCVQPTSDQGYIIAGYKLDFRIPSGADLLLIKADPDGEQTWVKTFDNSVREYGHSVRQTSDEGYIIAGAINVRITGGGPEDQYDVYLIKTDSSGTEQWVKTYQGMDQSYGYCIQQTSDGGYVIAGTTGSYGSYSKDAYLIKTDSSGNTSWTKTYGGSGYDEATCVQQTSDDGYLIAGYTDSYGRGEYDIFLIKTNSSGSMLWMRTYGGPYSDICTSVQLTSDEGFIIAGYTKSFGTGDFDDVYLIKTNSSGDTLWTKTYGGDGDDRAYSVQQTSDEGYIIAGYTRSFGAGDFDAYLIKTDAYGMVTDIEDNVPSVNPASFHLAQNYPNPFNPTTAISYRLPVSSEVQLTIYNLLGQEIQTLVNTKKQAGTHQVEWDGRGNAGKQVANGIYFYRIQADDFVDVKKMMLLR